jgi:hypothetical protein
VTQVTQKSIVIWYGPVIRFWKSIRGVEQLAFRILADVRLDVNVDAFYDEEDVIVDATGHGWHTRYSGSRTKMWDVLCGYTDENTAHNLIEEATGKGIDG